MDNSEALQTAIQLKERIENIEKHSNCIGSCDIHLNKTICDLELECEGCGLHSCPESGCTIVLVPEDRKKLLAADVPDIKVLLETYSPEFLKSIFSQRIRDLCERFDTKCAKFWFRDINLVVKHGEIDYVWNDVKNKLSFVESLYRSSEKSAFGNMSSVETKFDETVRKARELNATQWSVGSSLLEKIRASWKEHMGPEEVVIVPYKLNIYREGDFFLPHKDTPDDNLLGTCVFSVFDSSTGGGLFFPESPTTVISQHDGVLFYTDVLHEVKPVKGGHRVVLSFKIYGTGKNLSVSESLTQSLTNLASVVTEATTTFGVLLSHEYSLKNIALKGVDAVVYETFNRLPGFKASFLPVVVKLRLITGREYDFEKEYSCDIYPLDRDLPMNDNEFFHFTPGNFYTWVASYQDEYYCGNEARPNEASCIYVHTALLVERST